jgi:predicted nucleotidyltransferase
VEVNKSRYMTNMHTADFLFPRSTQRILAAVLLNPEREFIQTELVEAAGAGRGRGLALVRSMVEAGLAKTRRLGRQVLVSANRDHPVYPELRAFCVKSFGVADVIKEKLAPWADRIRFAFVFGSMAKGTDRPDSDIDLIVVGDVDLLTLAVAIEAVETSLGRSVHLLSYSTEEWDQTAAEPVMKSIAEGPKVMVFGNDPAR